MATFFRPAWISEVNAITLETYAMADVPIFSYSAVTFNDISGIGTLKSKYTSCNSMLSITRSGPPSYTLAASSLSKQQ